MCLKHYKSARRRGEITITPPPVYAKECLAEDCSADAKKRGYCDMHYRRLQRHGRIYNVRQAPGSLVAIGGGYLTQRVDGVKKLAHVRMVEKILGRVLPPGVEVHHVNEVTSDNRPENLVVCQDRQYHRTLHARQRALDACGNANWKHCTYCKQYDDPSNMTGRASRGQEINTFYHKACAAQRVREGKARRKAAAAA